METNIGVSLRKRRENSPDLEAFVDTDTGQRISYSQLNDFSNQCASSLVGMGIAMGDRIALLLPNGLEFVGLFYAAAKLGVVVVPLNTRLTPSELAFILQDSAPKALFFGDAFAATAAELRAGGDGKAIVEHWIESAPSSIDVTVSGKNPSLQNLLSAVVAEEPMDAGAGNDDNLFIMYTSGTTGAPKGVVHSHQSMMWSCLCWMASIDVRYRDRLLLPLPMFHVAALTTVIFSMLRGVTLVSMPVFDPSHMWDLLQEEEITIAGAVPAMLNFMLQVPGHEHKNTDHLRALISAAAPKPETINQRYQQ